MDASVAHSVVKTVGETCKAYVTLTPQNSSMEKVQLASPPDSHISIALDISTTEACRNLITTCKNVHENASAACSLVTFHNNKEEVNTPTTHLAIKLTDEMLKNEQQNIIPQGFKFIYELFLTEGNFHKFMDCIPAFVSWTQKRNASCILSIPAYLKTPLESVLINTPVKEVSRPFHVEASMWPPE
jgi:hypothetical protein